MMKNLKFSSIQEEMHHDFGSNNFVSQQQPQPQQQMTSPVIQQKMVPSNSAANFNQVPVQNTTNQ